MRVAYNKDMNNNSEHSDQKQLLSDVKFGATLLTLYAVMLARDSVCAANRKRKSILSFFHEAKEVLFGVYDLDVSPLNKTYKQSDDEL